MGAERHTVVVSDFHLCEAEPGHDTWLRYRQRRFFPDDDFARLVDAVEARVAPGDEVEWVFAGDLFEFDGPRVEGGKSEFGPGARTSAESAAALQRIAADHGVFFDSVAKLAASGRRVVFLAGNHDVHLAFDDVQSVLEDAIVSRAPKSLAARARANVVVVPWFYRSVDGVHVEHGHQYDVYCSYRDSVRPFSLRHASDAAGGARVTPTMGSLAFAHMVSRMGYFNPHDERSFMLSVPGYLAHWAKNYMFTDKSLARAWLSGAFRVFGELLAEKPDVVARAAQMARAVGSRVEYAKRFSLDARKVERHAALFAEPADAHLGRVVRELRLDYVAMGLLAGLGVAAAPFAPFAGLSFAAAAVGVLVARDVLFPRTSLDTNAQAVDAVAPLIGAVYGARAVVLGHTHKPYAEHVGELLVANSGSWAPSFDEHGDEARSFVWLRRPRDEAGAVVSGGLCTVRGGSIG